MVYQAILLFTVLYVMFIVSYLEPGNFHKDWIIIRISYVKASSGS